MMARKRNAALTANAQPTPTTAMSTPPISGPPNSVPWLSAPNHVMPFMTWLLGSSRGRNARSAGRPRMLTPAQKLASSHRCHTCTVPVNIKHGQQGHPREVRRMRVDQQPLPVHRIRERPAQKTEHDDRERHEYPGDPEVQLGPAKVEDQEADQEFAHVPREPLQQPLGPEEPEVAYRERAPASQWGVPGARLLPLSLGRHPPNSIIGRSTAPFATWPPAPYRCGISMHPSVQGGLSW